MYINNWIKQNPYFAAVIAVFVAYVAFTQLSGPNTYQDCVLEVVKEAKTSQAAGLGRRVCREKFPLPKFIDPFDKPPPKGLSYERP